MKKLIVLFVLFALPFAVTAQKKYSDEEILRMYKGLRVADVSDGMDIAGLPDVGLMDQRIQALWKDIDSFKHVICGIAVTARYVPTNRKVPTMTAEEYAKWEGNWYNTISPQTYEDFVKPGKVVVIDNQGDGDVGSVGSANSLAWVQKGAVGIISEGGVRDTDEIIKQKIPLYQDPLQRGRGIRPGRNELESVNKNIVVGNVLVRPGDIVVADGDGVIVVPREVAEPVATAARKVLEGDKKARRALYEATGIPLDQTVQ